MPRLPAWLAATLLLTLAAGSSLSLLKLQINNAPEVYFPADAPAVLFDQQLRKDFPQDQVLVVLFQGNDLFTASFLRRLDRVVKKLQANPLIERVFAPTSVDHIAASDDGFVVEPLVDLKQVGRSSERDTITRVLSDRFAPGLIVSRKGTAVALVVRPIPLDNSFKRLDVERATMRAIRQAGLENKVTAVAGHIALDVAELHSMVHDSLVFVPLTACVGLLLIWWLFRRIIAVILAMAAMGTVVTMTMAVIAVWGQPYTLVASVIPPLMAALTIALLIHFYNGLLHASHKGYGGAERVGRALQEVRRPALYTALTTAAGLASLALSPIQPIRTFGIAAGIGALLLYPVVIGLLPPLLVAWDRRPWPASKGSVRWIDRLVNAAARLAIRRAGWVVAVTALLLAAGLPFIFDVQVETDLYRFFGADHPLTRSTKLVEKQLSGVSTLEVVFDAPARDGLKDPTKLKALKRFQTWVNSLPEVDRSLSMTEIVEDMNWAFHGENPAFRKIPDSRRLISQYLFIYDGRDLYDLVDREFRRTRLTLNLNVDGANGIQKVIDRISAHLKKHPIAGLQWHIGGFGRLFSDQEDLLTLGQIRSLWTAFALIFAMMLIQWRSFSASVLCMIPNVAPILLIFMIMGAAGIWLDMATAMIASVAVGIAVDDTIHVYHSYSQRIAAGRGLALSLMRTYRQAGRAVVATTLILCMQFLLLTASAFVPTEDFGLLTSIGLLAALVFDLLLLPAMLVLVRRAALRRNSVHA